MSFGISHDRNDESPEAKARWFQSLTLAQRMDLLVWFTNLALSANPDLPDRKRAPTARCAVGGRTRDGSHDDAG